MNARDAKAEFFDVFLCHNSEDKPAVREIARQLAQNNIKPWLDEQQIRPGTSWQKALGQQIESIKSAAVFVGKSGLGPWQDQEIQALLSQLVKRECAVIPVVLPSAQTTPELPWTLANLHWVDFRGTHVDPLGQLIWGITGVKPRDQFPGPSTNNPAAPQEPDVKELLPRKDKVVIELRLPGNLDEFSDKERNRILAGLYSLLEVGEVRITRAVAGSIRLHLELTPEDADKIHAATQTGQLAALGISEVRLYPAIAVPPTGEERSQLFVLLDRVNETWVKGVLKNSLFNEALISLGKRPMDEAVEPPWKRVVALSSQRSQLLLKDRNITTLFDATGLLLILGEPGSGKTTTLLELAAHLISRAKADAKERIPVVLNLSSWKKKQPMVEWIAQELSEKYRVPIKLARAWLHKGYLVPLLDGLDEVPTALQPDCVAAINDFIDGSEPSGLVVCCRLTEYRWLPKRLKLNGAVCLESLSSEEVSTYLDKGGPKLATLREAVNSDSVLQELAQTPLMLSIMSLAYQEVSSDELADRQGDSPEERRTQIFGLYVEQMFQRKGTPLQGFPKEKTIRWLSWLAKKMREHSESVFLVEGLQPSWLGTRAQRSAYGTAVALRFGLIFGPIFGSISGSIFGLVGGLTGSVKEGPIVGLLVGLAYGLLVGLLVGLPVGQIGGLGAGSLNHINPVEAMSWKWKQAIYGSIPWLYLVLVISVFGGLLGGLVWLLFGLLFGLFFGLISGLVGGFTYTVKAGKVLPNEGIRLSRNNALAASFIACSTIGLLGGLIAGAIAWLFTSWALLFGLSCGLEIGLFAGLIVGLNRGGSAVIKHYALRRILWRSGYTPFNFIEFLDHCARLILLKKVGGGYIFIHRMLLDYFADMAP